MQQPGGEEIPPKLEPGPAGELYAEALADGVAGLHIMEPVLNFYAAWMYI